MGHENIDFFGPEMATSVACAIWAQKVETSPVVGVVAILWAGLSFGF